MSNFACCDSVLLYYYLVVFWCAPVRHTAHHAFELSTTSAELIPVGGKTIVLLHPMRSRMQYDAKVLVRHTANGEFVLKAYDPPVVLVFDDNAGISVVVELLDVLG